MHFRVCDWVFFVNVISHYSLKSRAGFLKSATALEKELNKLAPKIIYNGILM